jgi:hypothetical protein
MKVKINTTGAVVDIVPTSDTFLMIMAGIIEEVKPAPYVRKPIGNGVAVWKVVTAPSGVIAFPTIHAYCATCSTEQGFSEDRSVNNRTGRLSPSTMGNAIFHHCKRRDRIPPEILKEYEEAVLRGFRSTEAI